MEKYTPTPFMAQDSRYDSGKADFAVNFIECLCHTKGTWAGKPFELIDWQEQIIRDLFGTIKPNGYRQFNTAYIEIAKKQGKLLALDTPIPTPTGWSTMGKLQIGDFIFDENGKPCRVVAKSAVDDTEQAYRLTFRDGCSIVAGANHLWDAECIVGKQKKAILKTEEIFKMAQENPSKPVIRIPVAKPLQMDEPRLLAYDYQQTGTFH